MLICNYILISTLILTILMHKGAYSVTIQKAEDQTYETSTCGENLTLTCMFQKNTFVQWMYANDVTAIARCGLNTCDLNPIYKRQCSISCDKKQGIFNLTIINVTAKDDGKRMVCSDGSNTDSVSIQVRDYNPQLFEDAQSGTIKATSGCVSQDTEVSFKWIKISQSINSTMEEEFTAKVDLKKSTSCSNDYDCGYEQYVQFTEIVSAKANANGKYHFKIVTVYGNESKESDITVGKYMIETKQENSFNVKKEHYVLISTMTTCVLLIGIILLLHPVIRHKRTMTPVSKWNTISRTRNISFSARSSSASTSSNKRLVPDQSDTCETGRYSDVDKPDGTNNDQITMHVHMCEKLTTNDEDT